MDLMGKVDCHFCKAITLTCIYLIPQALGLISNNSNFYATIQKKGKKNIQDGIELLLQGFCLRKKKLGRWQHLMIKIVMNLSLDSINMGISRHYIWSF